MRGDIDEIKKAVLELVSAAGVTPSLGVTTLSSGDQVTAGGMVLGELGATLVNGPSDMNVNFWASIGVSSNLVNTIGALVTVGTKIYVGGDFTKIGGIAANYIAVYDTVTGVWSALGTGLNGVCIALTAIGTDVYAGGLFTLAGGVANTVYVAKWNGSAWSALGTGLDNTCRCLTIIGSNLYAGGTFTLAGGVANTVKIAKWNGAAWSALGTGLNSTCNALAEIGSDLYAGGLFTLAGGVANTVRIAKWDGATWSALGTGLDGQCNALAVSDLDLFVGGAFTLAGGVANTIRIAKWDGATWSALGVGLDNSCLSLAVIGTDLFAGGSFSIAGETSANCVAMWNGDDWFALGGGLGNSCLAMAVLGNDLYVGGAFNTAGGRASRGIAAYLQTLQSVLAYLEITIQALQDAIVTDVTLYDVSTSNHGLVPKPDGSTSKYLSGDGTFRTATPAAHASTHLDGGSDPIVTSAAFTPIVEGITTAGAGTYTTQLGAYYTIGKLVFFEITLVWTAHTGTGNMRVNGLPFTSANNSIYAAAGVAFSAITLLAIGNKVQAYVAPNTTQVQISEVGSGALSSIPMDTAGTLIIAGCYLKA